MLQPAQPDNVPPALLNNVGNMPVEDGSNLSRRLSVAKEVETVLQPSDFSSRRPLNTGDEGEVPSHAGV